MRLLNKPLFLSLFFPLVLIPAVFAEDITITTYYPAPYGSYNELQLYPHATVTSCNDANKGVMYYDSNDNTLYVCKGAALGWQAGGYWLHGGTPPNDYIYPNNLNWKVGIGTATPNNTIQVANLINFPNSIFGTFLGYQAGNSTTGSRNTFVGYQAGLSNTTGSYNTATGFRALYSNTTGIYNTANGYMALLNNTTGSNTAYGYQALLSNTTGQDNTANGTQSLAFNTTGSYNTANGFQALLSNTTGNYNTANGYQALLQNTTGSWNTANGFQALLSNTVGEYNTASGYHALRSNTVGEYNTATGFQALLSNTTGNYNTANGYQALRSNTTGLRNTANGTQALALNTTGSNNTANGSGTLASNTTGLRNTANGDGALLYNTTGSNNTACGYLAGHNVSLPLRTNSNSVFVGYNANTSADGLNNVIVIGSGAQGTKSNLAVLGNSFVSETWLRGNVGIGTTSPRGTLDVNGTIFLSGLQIHPPADYVFEPEYSLESIEEHAAYMWKNKHLKAVPKVQVDEDGKTIIEIGANTNGILEELEKAHIYIEQLNKRIKDLEAKIEEIQK